MTHALRNVLIIDDNPGDNLFHEMAIKETVLAAEVVCEERPEHALVRLADGDLLPDLILLDINMPLMDGWAFMEALDGLPTQVHRPPIVLMVSDYLLPDTEQRIAATPLVKATTVKAMDGDAFRQLVTELFPAVA